MDFISDLTFLQALTILLLGLLFFKEDIMPWIKNLLGVKSSAPPHQPATSNQVNELAEYVNHRQSEILERQLKVLERIDDRTKEILRKHEEYDKYGVKVRTLIKDE